MDELTMERARQIVENKFDHRLDTNEDAWWHQGNRATYLKLLERLCEVLDVGDALEYLERAYQAAADEYGD